MKTINVSLGNRVMMTAPIADEEVNTLMAAIESLLTGSKWLGTSWEAHVSGFCATYNVERTTLLSTSRKMPLPTMRAALALSWSEVTGENPERVAARIGRTRPTLEQARDTLLEDARHNQVLRDMYVACVAACRVIYDAKNE